MIATSKSTQLPSSSSAVCRSGSIRRSPCYGHEPFFKGVLADEIEAEHVKIHGGIDSAGDKSYDWFGHTKRLEMMITGMAKIFPDGGYL